MTTTASLATALSDLLGPNALTAGPVLTAAPASAEDAARVLAAAREAGASVIFQGGGTGRRIGLPPARVDLVLDTRRLDRVVEWEPADLTVCVEAGMTLRRLEETLAEQGQQVPIDAPVPWQATIGGLVAANVCGPRRWQYGGWRDLIIGMHMALPDGAVIKSGGRVVKNVQGYDLAKLFTGALGTLGLITQVNLKIAPMPETRVLLMARGSLAAVFAYLERVAASTARVATLDLLDADATHAVGLHGAEYTGLVVIEGQHVVVNAQVNSLRGLSQDESIQVDVVDGRDFDPVWANWRELGRTDDLSDSEALLTVSSLPSDVPAAMEATRAAAEAKECGVRIWARAGNGLVYARLLAPVHTPLAPAAVQSALLARWPATTLTAGSAGLARAARTWGAHPAALAMMRALKQRFDPDGILQPGRYLYDGSDNRGSEDG